MDPNNPVVKFCIDGLRNHAQGKVNEALACYKQAWKIRKNDLDACIAAHYLAKEQKTPKATLAWNLKALDFANNINTEFVTSFYPSLYINIADSYEKVGLMKEANRYYNLAASTANEDSLGSHGYLLLDSIKKGLKRTNSK